MMCVCLPVWKAWSWPILVLLWMLWFMAFKCPEWEPQLCHKENNWIGNVLLLAAEPMVLVGVGGCSHFLSVSCSAMLLWICEGFPNEALEIVTHFAIKTYVNPLDVEPWHLVKQGSWRAGPSTQAGRNINALQHLCLTLRHAGAWSLGAEGGLHIWGKQRGENSCCAVREEFHTLPTVYFNPQPGSMEGVMAAMQLHFIMPLRLITWPVVFVTNICCKPSLHISAKLAQKSTYTWQYLQSEISRQSQKRCGKHRCLMFPGPQALYSALWLSSVNHEVSFLWWIFMDLSSLERFNVMSNSVHWMIRGSLAKMVGDPLIKICHSAQAYKARRVILP